MEQLFLLAAIPDSTVANGDKDSFFHENFLVDSYHVLSISSSGIFLRYLNSHPKCKFLPSICKKEEKERACLYMPCADEFLNCDFSQVKELAKDENEVSQTEDIQEIKVMWNFTCYVCFKVVQEHNYIYIYFFFFICVQCRSLTIRYDSGLMGRKETYGHCYQHYNT